MTIIHFYRHYRRCGYDRAESFKRAWRKNK